MSKLSSLPSAIIFRPIRPIEVIAVERVSFRSSMALAQRDSASMTFFEKSPISPRTKALDFLTPQWGWFSASVAVLEAKVPVFESPYMAARRLSSVLDFNSSSRRGSFPSLQARSNREASSEDVSRSELVGTAHGEWVNHSPTFAAAEKRRESVIFSNLNGVKKYLVYMKWN